MVFDCGISWLYLLVFCIIIIFKISKGAKIRNRYNQVPHLTQDTNGKVINLQLDTTNENQEVSLTLHSLMEFLAFYYLNYDLFVMFWCVQIRAIVYSAQLMYNLDMVGFSVQATQKTVYPT